MGIQVPLLVIDWRRVSVMSTLFSNRRVRTLKVSMTVIMSLCILMYRRSSESRMRSGTLRGVSKWSRRKDRYIGRLYSEFGKVPSDSGIFRSTGELREYELGLLGPYGKEGKGHQRWSRPSPWSCPNWTREGERPLPSFSFSLPFPSLLLLLHGRIPSWTRKRGILLPVGVGLPLARQT